jgi:hypothetical protein
MLSPNLEHELRTEFVNVGSRIQAPDGLTERLLCEDYRPRGRARLLVPLLVCSIAVLTLGGVLVAINLSGRQPAAASVLASEFNVFNRPATSSVAIPSKWLTGSGIPSAKRNAFRDPPPRIKPGLLNRRGVRGHLSQ